MAILCVAGFISTVNGTVYKIEDGTVYVKTQVSTFTVEKRFLPAGVDVHVGDKLSIRVRATIEEIKIN